MAKWLDKYEQGGLVLKKKTKDNFSLKGNANDSKVSAGPNFVGEGYTAYNWKSPAWGGQFAMGGSLPGSVGFMYARTINPAPANGKYTKKTLASAQFGMELMPYMAQAAVSVKNALPSIEDIKNKAVDKTKEVIKNSPTARKLINKTISAIANSDWGKEKLQNFARNIHPRGYSSVDQPFERIYSTAIKNKKESYREELDKELATPGKAFSSDSVRVDLLNRYAGLPEKYNTLKPSLYIPSGGNKNEKYFSSPQIEREILEELNTISNGVFQKKGFKTKKELEELIAKTSSHVEDPKRPGEYVPIKGKGNNYVAPIPGLGQGTYGIGEDEKGHYLSYYDLWDLNPYYGEYATASNSMDKLGQEVLGNEKEDVATKHIGNPTKMYGRIYFDKKTGKPKMQNGGEMAFYQNGLDFKPKSISKKGKKIIKDDMGQWAHPGEITEINSPDITMQGVDYPVLGISDTGDTKMMYPDQDYKFDGKKVTEYPMAQNGWLSKYTPEPMRQDATRNKQFEESVKNTIDQYRRAIDPENQPHISKWTPKPGEIKRLEEQDRQRREENSGFLNRLAANPHVAKLQNNVLIPMFDLYTVGEGAVAAKAIAKPALKQAGKYLTEKTALKNAYKLNPKAFKPTEGMMYRGLGKEGMEDAFESGVFRAKQDVEPIMHGPFDFSKQFNKAYFSPKFDVADRYGKGYIAEVPRAASDWGKRYGKKEWSQIAQKDIPITEGKILQKDWWKGYKEVPRNKMSAPEITRGPVNWWESPTFKKNNPNYDPTKPPLNPFPKYTAENVPEELKPYLTWDTEIDWGKWNPEIPKNEKLMQEYINIENTAKNEGTWMKNYDGTPFAGTPEQFVQSRSENFKKAFPQGADVVYRGDHSHYEALRGKGEELYGKPIFTTPDKELAEIYAYREPMTSPYYNPNIETVEQKLQRMYGPDMTVEKFRNEYPEIAGRILETNDGGLYELAIPKTTNELTFDAGKNLHHYLSNPEVYDKLIKEGIFPHKRPEPGIFDTDNVAELIEKTGIDRAIIKNVNDGKIADVLIHNQRPGKYAKSLRGNSGMFDMNNPNIYKALIPAVGTAGLVGASQKKHGGWLNKYK